MGEDGSVMVEAFIRVDPTFIMKGLDSPEKSPLTRTTMVGLTSNGLTSSEADQDLRTENDLLIHNLSDDDASSLTLDPKCANQHLLTTSSASQVLKTSLADSVLKQDESDRSALLQTVAQAALEVCVNLQVADEEEAMSQDEALPDRSTSTS